MLPLMGRSKGSRSLVVSKRRRRGRKGGCGDSRLAVAGLAAANLSPAPRRGPPRLGSPDRQSPSVSAEAKNQAQPPTTPDSALFSRRLPARGSFPIVHKTNSSVSLRGLLPVPPPSSGRKEAQRTATTPPVASSSALEKGDPLGVLKIAHTSARIRQSFIQHRPRFGQSSNSLHPTSRYSLSFGGAFDSARKGILLLPRKRTPRELCHPATVDPSYEFVRIYLLTLFLLLPQPPPPPSPTTTTTLHHHPRPWSISSDFAGNESAAPSQRQSAAPL